MRFIEFDCTHIVVKYPEHYFGISGIFYIGKYALQHHASVALMPVGFEGMDADQLGKPVHILFPGRIPPCDAVGGSVQL